MSNTARPRSKKTPAKKTEEAPLKVEVARDAASGALVHKLIQSGHVQIAHGEDRKVDIVYEQVKFTGECKPVSGRLLIKKSTIVEPLNTSNVLNVRFGEGEIFLYRKGGEEKKIEEMKLRLEDCGENSKK
jgi:hypothetical protein